ncbi:MAG: acyl-CoA desaturase [Gemmataceae bacterium]
MSFGMQAATLVAIALPFLGLVGAVGSFWGHGLSWAEPVLLAGMYVTTMLGVTVGYHRLFTHRSFRTNAAVKFILAALGSMTVQGPLFQWVATHRRHHQFSDLPDDPHTPHGHGRGIFGLLRGLWHSHLGWIFDSNPPGLSRYVADLQQSRSLRVANAMFFVWVFAGVLIPAAIGGLVAGTWTGAWFGLIWGGLVRIFLAHHVTWCVNSVCHLWGRRPFQSEDHSRNNIVFGILALGEGWHNTHHAFPTSARHGLRWWQFDLSYWVIRGLVRLRLAWDVRLPAESALAGLRSAASS